jgi:sensor histidine kinase YesM
MGHKPTVMVALLATALTIAYVIVPEAGKFTFLVLMAASWFLVAICWLAQKSADYMKKGGYGHEEKKKLVSTSHHQQTVQVTSNQIKQAKLELGAELDELQNMVKNKDSEIEKLKNEIANLQTLVQIEALKTDLANLKALAAKEDSKSKNKK